MNNLQNIISALSLLGHLTCECCHRSLIDDDENCTVIKKHLVISYKKKGIIEIECRHCSNVNIIANSN